MFQILPPITQYQAINEAIQRYYDQKGIKPPSVEIDMFRSMGVSDSLLQEYMKYEELGDSQKLKEVMRKITEDLIKNK